MMMRGATFAEFDDHFYLEDGGRLFLRNIGNHPQD
jgi:hypothetical protein